MTKTFTVAQFSILVPYIHVNCMTHVVVATFIGFHDGSSYDLSGFSERAGDIHLKINSLHINSLGNILLEKNF